MNLSVPGEPELPSRWRYKIDPDEALRLVLDAVGAPRRQQVPLRAAHGRILAEEIHADRGHPPFARAMMDGYAVRVAQAGTTVDVVGEVAAGPTGVRGSFLSGPRLGDRQCLEIMTGAPCPPGAEAVVPKEQARREGNRVTLPENITLGEHIAAEGSECAAGGAVLRPGDLITSLAVAVLAAFGRETVVVTRRPALAIITTGSELVLSGRQPASGQIRNSNGPMLAALARATGVESLVELHAKDDVEAIQRSLQQAADSDMVLLTGGVSAGKFDLVAPALAGFGAEPIFRQVTQRPGKPFLLARKAAQLFFGLPGNPLAAHLVFHRYVAAAIGKMAGRPPAGEFRGQLAAPVRAKGERTDFLLARAQRQGCSARGEPAWLVYPLRAASSADIFTPAGAGANCYLRVSPEAGEIAAGEPILFEWINDVVSCSQRG